jgi:mannose-6-phosphate isomerase-like protein (cupin superfamily)
MNSQVMQKKNLDKPDEQRTFSKGHLNVVSLGEMSLGRATFEPGWKWSECVKPIAKTKSCEAPHFGYVLKGRMHVVMDDGTHLEFGPGDAMLIPPKHDAWIVGNETCEIVDFTGYEHYAKH